MFRDWLKSCENGHPNCTAPKDVSRPKRVLACTTISGVKLCSTSEDTPCEYLALSYCWGGTQPPKTTLNNLVEHEQQIPWDSLPTLYQDAVLLARWLNVPHLWIDSLCIVQDDEKERDCEIARMGNIFQSAFFVVIAASSESPRTGFLRRKSRAFLLEDWKGYVWRKVNMVHYGELIKLDGIKVRRRVIEHGQVDACRSDRIAARAWTYQERLLARRCLIFRNHDIAWECKSTCFCECTGVQTLLPMKKRLKPQLLPRIHPSKDAAFPNSQTFFVDSHSAYKFWKGAVKTYSSRRLSCETDRLPAISALASAVFADTGDEYLAGLWRSDLVAQLMWYNIPSYEGTQPHGRYIAPSWSWASTPVPTCYDEMPFASRVEIKDAWCTRAGLNTFGPVIGGAIVLRGIHCQADVAILRSKDTQWPVVRMVFAGGKCHEAEGSHWEFSFLDGFRVHTVRMTLPSGDQLETVQRVQGVQADDQAPVAGKVRLLWLTDFHCLVLAYSQREMGAFERLGILDVSMSPSVPDISPTEIKLL